MAIASNGNCEIYYESFGAPADPTLLLVNGLGSQCINYHEDWCAMFVTSGLHVVRFDNRDVGLSSKFDSAPTGAHGETYSLSDMAADAVAVLDAIGVERAHVMGLSMGGMIVQVMAIEYPHRLLSMTSVMSSTRERGYGEPTPEAFVLLTAPPAIDRESFVRDHIDGLRVWGSPAFADEARWRRDAERAYDRCFHPSGSERQYHAILAAPRRADQLGEVTTPTLVIHGDCDTLIDVSGGRRTAELIPGARFEIIEGMGHDYPPQLWDRWVGLVSNFVLGRTSSTA
ncbi:MAG: alpha/beta fold hydrolase [Actinomycetota bacterium]|nr:alpha/beta fold hydrolase [Actinomycetota bacterium]